MAFLDKLNEFAKSVSDAANDAVETTRAKSKINLEKKALDEAYRKIGEHYYNKRASGAGPVDDEVLELCIEVEEHLNTIAGIEADLEREREAKECRQPEPRYVSCQSCGAKNDMEAKFCRECGAQLEKPVVAVLCPSCGAANDCGARFCSECGAKL